MSVVTISPTEAIELAAKHVAGVIEKRIRENESINVRDGWPDGLYQVGSREPVWCISIPGDQPTIGSSRVICISKRTGQVLFDGMIGE